MVQAYRFALDPSPAQERALWSHAGGKRFAFNWMLRHVSRALEAQAFLRSVGDLCDWDDTPDREELVRDVAPVPWTTPALRKAWNAAKDRDAPWWAQNSKETYSSAATALAASLENFFKSRSGERAGARMGWPKPKKRRDQQSFTYTTGSFGLADNTHAKLPRIGRVHLHESARKLGRRVDHGTAVIKSATVSHRGGRWFVSFTVWVQRACGLEGRRPDRPAWNRVVGVDWSCADALGIVAFPDGQAVRVPNPRAYRVIEDRLARLQQCQARCKPGSNRHRKYARRIARLQNRARNVRTDAIHKYTHWLATSFSVVVTETLNVRGMTAAPAPKPNPDEPGRFLPNGRAAKSGLAKSVLDAAPAAIDRQLAYKTGWYGSVHLRYPPFEQSTGVCGCGAKAKLTLADRTWTCSGCGTTHDRDTQAAVTLARWGEQQLQASSMLVPTGSGPAGTARLRPPGLRESRTTRQVGKTGTAYSQGQAA